ncbi:MAG: SH3 domain-containing protein [Chloroflexota bacterium]
MSRLNIKSSTIIVLSLLAGLTACAGGNDTPAPTIIPLGTNEAGSSAARPVTVWPSATPIPPPSPTPSRTPTWLPALISLTPTPTPATPLAEVIVTSLNVRRGPGPAYPVIGTARAGDQFTVIGLDPSGEWLQVVLAEGDPGWISAQRGYTRLLAVDLADLPFVEPPPAPAQAAAPDPATAGQTEGLAGRLVFATGSGGELYVINIDGSGLRRLAGGVIDPALAPDGRQVAFVRWDGAEFGALYTLNLDGSGERAIVGDIRQPKSPAWSPDGRRIIISFQHGGLRDPEETCKEYDFDDGVRIPENVGQITKTRISADGIVICYIPKEDLKWDLREIELTTARFEDLPADPYSYTPAWDPQQPWRVIYEGEKGLMQFDVSNHTNWPITTDGRDTGPVFSPDGRYLAVTYRQHDHWEVYTLDLQTGERRRLTKPPLLADPQYNSAAPAWSPDGRHLAFVTDRTGQWEMWVMAADGSRPRPLFTPEVAGQFQLDYRGVNERLLNWAR